MARRTRNAQSLADLERRLHTLDTERRSIIDEIRTALHHLTSGFAAPMAGLDVREPREPRARRARAGAGSSGVRKRPVLSPEARARIAAAQRKRWAEYRKKNQRG
jgi:hypothetical protein